MLMVTHTTCPLTEYIFGKTPNEVRQMQQEFINKVKKEGSYVEDLPPKIVKLRTGEYSTIVKYKKKLIS